MPAGRVHPRRAGLFRAVSAIVEDEDELIPLTWLIRLLRETRHFPGIERIDVVRRRSSWRCAIRIWMRASFGGNEPSHAAPRADFRGSADFRALVIGFAFGFGFQLVSWIWMGKARGKPAKVLIRNELSRHNRRASLQDA